MNHTSFKTLSILAVLVLLVSACGVAPVFGSGDLVTETRSVSGFDSISVSGDGRLVVIQDGTESVTVETDDNLMPYVVTEVKNGTLDLYLDNQGLRNFNPSELIFTVHVKDLTGVSASGSWEIVSEQITTDSLSIHISGSGEVKLDDLQTAQFSVEVSGSAKVEAAGEALDQQITVSGSGKFECPDLYSETTTINISGSSTATVWVGVSLTVDISGSGKVSYYGSPQTTINTSGSGSLVNLGEK